LLASSREYHLCLYMALCVSGRLHQYDSRGSRLSRSEEAERTDVTVAACGVQRNDCHKVRVS